MYLNCLTFKREISTKTFTFSLDSKQVKRLQD